MLKILLADDHKIVREGLRALLQSNEDIEVIAEASNGLEAVALARENRPDVAVLDVIMPQLNGIDAARQISAMEGVGVVALSMYSDRHFIMEMLQAGATGFLLKDCASEELVAAVREVGSGGVFFGPSVSDIVADAYVRMLEEKKQNRLGAENLTPREREVLLFLAEGKTVREIAEIMAVSPKTVDTHKSRMMDKLHLDNMIDLAKYAIRRGIISAEI